MAATSKRNGKQHSDHHDAPDYGGIAELITDSVEASVRTSVEMAKIPLTLCAALCETWSKALDSIAKNVRPD